MATTEAYCAVLDVKRDMANATDREEFLLEKLRDLHEEHFDALDRALGLEEAMDPLRDRVRDLESELPDVKAALQHEYEHVDQLKDDLAALAKSCDELRARAERAEESVRAMRAGLRGIVVTRRGNTLHLHLPEALHVPAPGWDHPWNTLSVPVVAAREPSVGRKKMVDDLPRATGTTWLTFSPERTEVTP